MKVAPRVPRPLDEGLFCIFTDIFMNQIDEQEEYCLREALQRAGAGENPVRGCGGNGLVSGFLNISRKTRAFPRYPESDSSVHLHLGSGKAGRLAYRRFFNRGGTAGMRPSSIK